ncbi:hypothetical protein Sango_2108000 [Sesamum angolense]|uniref:DUF4283 domain-containing protein n=1 Tax=Sesamum angolense TaxID=2727404 RepID=A0AAE1WBW8_9LAMI|nr:hypothetical protein Sango_2108000 [Sesamum angolense]
MLLFISTGCFCGFEPDFFVMDEQVSLCCPVWRVLACHCPFWCPASLPNRLQQLSPPLCLTFFIIPKAKKTKKLVAAAACLESGQSSTKPLADGQPAPIFVKALEVAKPAIAPISAKKFATGAETMAIGLRTRCQPRRCYRPRKPQSKPGLGADDLIDVRTKLGYCLVGYIAGKFSGLQPIRALFKSWGASFQQHDSGWLIFHFAQDDDQHRILACGPYFVNGRPLLLKAMPDCFEFKEDDISLTPVWATLPSLPLECWHPNALGKIGSRLGTPIAMDSFTMKMERVSYARILVEVDTSKPLVDQVDCMLPNGVMRTQPVVYEFTTKFCTNCNLFGHLEMSCQGAQSPAAGAAIPAVSAATDVPSELKKGQPTGWTIVK